jgi:hypothetical protein
MREIPYIAKIEPERVVKFKLKETGDFQSVSFEDTIEDDEGETIAVVRTYTDEGWDISAGEEVLSQGTYNIGMCPVIAFSETDMFPNLGGFENAARISLRLFNLQSELDELLRSQTFSIMYYPLSENSPIGPQNMGDATNAISETVGTNNMLLTYGGVPGFIAPPSGPAETYLAVIAQLKAMLRDATLTVDPPANSQESGVALKLRFQVLNSALIQFSNQLQSFERKVWNVVAAWVGVKPSPDTVSVAYNDDFTLSEMKTEIEILQQMQAIDMPLSYINRKRKALVALDLGNENDSVMQEIYADIDSITAEVVSPDETF